MQAAGQRTRAQAVAPVRSLAGQPVRLRFVLRDADLYAFQFAPYAPDPEPPDLSGIELP